MSSLESVLSSQLASLNSEFPTCVTSTLTSTLSSRTQTNLDLWRVFIGTILGRLIRNYGRNVNDAPPYTESDAADNLGELLITTSYSVPRLFSINLNRPSCKVVFDRHLPPAPDFDCEDSEFMRKFKIKMQALETRGRMGCLLRDSKVPAFKLKQLNKIHESVLLDLG